MTPKIHKKATSLFGQDLWLAEEAGRRLTKKKEEDL